MAMIFALGILMLIAIFGMSLLAKNMNKIVKYGYDALNTISKTNRDYLVKMYNE